MTAQQINLYDASRPRTRTVLGSAQLGWASLAVAGLGIAASLTLHGLSVHERTRIREIETDLNALRRAAGAPMPPADRVAELERLQALETARVQVRSAMQLLRPSGAESHASHGSQFFDALSRHARGALWLTGFSVAADGEQIELAGRMLSAAALPAYLRSLNDEPLFRGRPFAQLDIKGGGRGDAASLPPGVVEFTLRSQTLPEGSQR